MLADTIAVRPTRDGFRLSQHGVVLSELRVSPGPTHSVFDVLAALVAILRPRGRIGLLGFAAGSVMAPLRALGVTARVEAVDLDRSGYELFLGNCRAWAGDLAWTQADAVTWLNGVQGGFDTLVDDLSIPISGDVTKPSISWEVLPSMIRDKLAVDGIAVLNLLKPEGRAWVDALCRLAGLFPRACVVHLDAFENRLLVAGRELPPAREMSEKLRCALRRIQSRQAKRFQVRNFAPGSRCGV